MKDIAKSVAIGATATNQSVTNVLMMFVQDVNALTNPIYQIHLQKGTNHEY